jgi:hypothetical protein
VGNRRQYWSTVIKIWFGTSGVARSTVYRLAVV